MSDFRERFIELLETEYIQPKEWYDIIKVADFETLYFIRDDVMMDSKYATKEDYLDYSTRQEIISRIDKRVNVSNSLVDKWFGDLA